MAASSISVNSETGAKGEVASSVKKVTKNYPLHTSTSLGEGFHSLYECPINEENIESVLDESIAVTAAMRTQLAALKEDLKRLGGGSNMSTNLKPVHIQRRLEVASHLAVAFLQYQKSMDTIGEFNQLPELDFSHGAWSMSEVGAIRRGGVSGRGGGRGSRGPYGKRGGGRGINCSAPHLSEPLRDIKLPKRSYQKQPAKLSNLPSQSAFTSTGQPGQVAKSSTTLSHQSAAQIANDLWMSCEPGSDDEESFGPHGKRSLKKR